MNHLTSEELREMREYTEAATVGPWETFHDSYVGHHGVVTELKINGVTGEIFEEADATFIARARTDLPRLLREIAALRCLEVEVEFLRKQNDVLERRDKRYLETLRIFDQTIWALEDIKRESWSPSAVSTAKVALARVDEYKHRIRVGEL